MAKVWRFHQIGGPEVLRLETIALPELADDDVHIRVQAIGLNRADIMFRNDQYILKAVLPSRLGYEAAGIVIKTGKGVTDFAPGDAVSVVPPDDLGRYGTCADELVLPSRYLAHKPADVSFEAAAGAWMQYLTAWGGIVHAARVKKGDYVLITAASSSVGLAAIQVARLAGAIPVAYALSSVHRKTLLEMGAAHVITADQDDLASSLAEITGPEGLDAAFDAVAGPDVTVIANALKRFGRLIIHGALSPEQTPFPLKPAIRKSLAVEGYLFTEVLTSSSLRDQAKSFILDGLTSGRLSPFIERTFPFEQLPEAQRYLAENRQFGKVVLQVS